MHSDANRKLQGWLVTNISCSILLLVLLPHRFAFSLLPSHAAAVVVSQSVSTTVSGGVTAYNVTFTNLGARSIVSLVVSATSFIPLAQWGLVSAPSENGQLTLYAKMFPILPSEIVTQIGYLQLAPQATFIVQAVTFG